MRVDRLGLVLRARTSWEAIDLGLALARHHAGAWLAPWWLIGGLLAAALLALGHVLDLVAWVPLAFWWLKPALDRLPLFVLSRAVFGHVPTRAEVYRAAWRWGWGPTLPRLLWLRFDPFRALSMPSDLLEGLPRSARAARRGLLRREGAAQAGALWLLLPWFETALWMSVYALVALMIPLEWWEARGGTWMETLTSGTPAMAWLDLLSAALLCAAMLAIEPFYVAGGFGLYLGRRVHLEAWDLELAFKRMAARALSSARALAAALLVGAGVLGALGMPFEASAQQATSQQATSQQPTAPPAKACPAPGSAGDAGADRAGASVAEGGGLLARPTPLPAGFGAADAARGAELAAALRRVRAHESLGGTETVQRWRVRPDLWPALEDDTTVQAAFDWQAWLGRMLGAITGAAAELILWAVALALLAWLLWRFRDWLPWRRDAAAEGHAPPPLRHRALQPEDVAAAPELLRRARALWQRGEAREAFACLYRAGFREVSARRPRPLPPGTTEGELLRAARALEHAPAAAHVQRLVHAWRGVAYAGARPDAEAFDALIAAWPSAFGEVRA